MKNTIMSLAVIIMATCSVNAQEAVGAYKQAHHKTFRQHHLGRMTATLQFTDQQKEQLKTINGDFHVKMKALKQQDEITVKEMNTQRQRLLQEHTAKVQALLTPAQKDQFAKMKEERKALAEVKAATRAEKLKIKLGLSDEQAGKLKGIRTDMVAKMKAIRSDNSISREDRQAQIKSIVAAQQEQLKTILTPEQQLQLEQLKQQHHKRDWSK
jgi:Spy/CpxP family protein refolding chaperone